MLIQLFSIELRGYLPIKTGMDENGFCTCDFQVTEGKVFAAEGHSGRRRIVTFGCFHGQFMLKSFQFRTRDTDMKTKIIFVPVFHRP